MIASDHLTREDIKHPMNLMSKSFRANRFAHYRWLREEAPVYRGKISVMNLYFVSRYEDCVSVSKDPRFVRNRSTATGGRRFPIPFPRSIEHLMKSMILEDGGDHRRLRGLVQQAFTPGALAHLEGRIETLTHELLDEAEKKGDVDLMTAYSFPIPVTITAEMVGVANEDMPGIRNTMKVLSNGLSGWNIFRTFFWDLRKTSEFIRGLIAKKRRNPGDDILSGLIKAEENGERLSEDELVSMVFLLVIAGYETTVHLISNGVLALLEHPEQLALLRERPELMDSAVEEILRYAGPIHATKPNYAMQDVELHGVTIPKGAMVMPLLGSANRDDAVFEDPDVFNIERTPNRHLAFGFGPHTCLGAPLARMETRIALKNLLERNPNLSLGVERDELKLQRLPGWYRYESMPVNLG
ncbi:MAG: cytochrome P450 [Candidatus Hydrogenedentota bacterium]